MFSLLQVVSSQRTPSLWVKASSFKQSVEEGPHKLEQATLHDPLSVYQSYVVVTKVFSILMPKMNPDMLLADLSV